MAKPKKAPSRMAGKRAGLMKRIIKKLITFSLISAVIGFSTIAGIFFFQLNWPMLILPAGEVVVVAPYGVADDL